MVPQGGIEKLVNVTPVSLGFIVDGYGSKLGTPIIGWLILN